MAQPPPKGSKVPMIAPGSVTGFVSSRSAMALPKGAMAVLNDVRLDEGCVRVRWGGLQISAAINGAQIYRGAFECSLNGTPTLFAATSDGSKVSVLRSLDAGATFAAITTTSPDNRLTESGRPLSFGLVSLYSKDYLVVQNGVDSPRYYDGTVVRAVPTLDTTGYRVRTSIDLGGGTSFAGPPSVATTGDEWDAPTGTRPFGSGYSLYLQSDGHVTTASLLTVGPLSDPIAVPTDATRQVLFVLDCGTPTSNVESDPKPFPVGTRDERWRNLVIEGSEDGSTWLSIYDPKNATLIAIPYGETLYLAAVPVGAVAGRTLRYLRFSYPVGTGETHDPDIITRFYTVQASGPTFGGTAYGASFGQEGQTVATDGPTRSGGIVSEAATAASYGGVALPIDGQIGYADRVTVTKPNPAVQVPVYVYRNDLGASGYYAVDSFLGPGTYVDPGAGTVDFTRDLPDGDAIPMPKGTNVATVNGRLFVCAGNRLYYSEIDRPFTFSLNVRFDDSGQAVAESAGSFSRPGETFQSVVAIGGFPVGTQVGEPTRGSVALYALTDRCLGAMSGYDALSLNRFRPFGPGTRSPGSVAITAGGFYYLDSLRQVRAVRDGQSQALSRYRVDGEFAAIPDARLAWASGACVDERYYLAYDNGGAGLNASVIVHNEALGWESIDRPRRAAQGLLPYYDAATGRTRLLAFSDVALAEHAARGAQADLDAARVAARIVFPEVSFDGQMATYGTATYLVETDAGGTLSLSVSDGFAYAAVPLASRRTAFDPRINVRSKTDEGGMGITVQPSLAISAVGGTRLFRMDLELYPTSDSVVP